MNLNELQEIKKRAENAAPGPWEVRNDNEGTEYFPFWVIGENEFDGGDQSMELHVGYKEDADFIAHAREDVPALVAEVERLLDENAKFANSILINARNELERCEEIADLQLENEKLKYLMKQMVSKKMYKIIIDFVEGRLKELPF